MRRSSRSFVVSISRSSALHASDAFVLLRELERRLDRHGGKKADDEQEHDESGADEREAPQEPHGADALLKAARPA
jgi:hypothetical protein